MQATWFSDFRAAYASLWRWLGILLAAVPVLSLLAHLWSLPLGALIAELVSAYRAIFHPLIDVVLRWLPWRFPQWAHDVGVGYFLVGGAVGRTLWTFYQRHDPKKGDPYGPFVIGRFSSRIAQTLAVLLSIPLWPLSLAAILAAPYVMRNPNNGNVFSGNRTRFATWRKSRPNLEYQCNLRVVFVLQLLAVIAVCAGVILTTGVLRH